MRALRGRTGLDDFISTKDPVPVEVELSSTDSGGLHNPVVPDQNFRPDMYIGSDNRQFWGQIDFAEIVYPGSTSNGLLHAVYPYDLCSSFTAGATVELLLGDSYVGKAKLLKSVS